MNFKLLLLPFLALILVCNVTSCGSNDEDEMPPLPLLFNTVDAVADTTSMGTPERIDIDALRNASNRDAFWLHGVAPDSSEPRVGIAHRLPLDETGVERDEYLAYEPASDTFTPLLEISPLFAASLSRDLSSAAWIENCLGYTQTFDATSTPILVNPLLREGACLRPPQLSEGGEIAVFSSARGRIDDTGTLQFDGFDNNLFGPVIHHPANGTALSLAGIDVELGDVLLDERIPLYLNTELADDGSRLALRTAFVPEDVMSAGTIEFPAGVLVVDTDTGSTNLIGRHLDRRAFCLKCPTRYADDMRLSGDGKVVYFMRPPEGDLTDPPEPTQLYRHDLASNDTRRVLVEDVVEKRSLITNGDGSRVAYVTNDGPVLLRLDTWQRITIDRALRVCTEDDCAFESYRFVRSNPLALSKDGSTLLISVIPERAGIQTPQNTEEIMILDVDTLRVKRLAPEISIDRVASSNDGHLIVFQSDSVGLIPNDEDNDSDFFLLQR